MTPIKTGMSIRRPTYKLLIDGRELALFSYEVQHSLFTPSSFAKLTVEKVSPAEGTPVELHLGYDDALVKVFKGYVEETFYSGEKACIIARNYHYFFLKEKVSGALMDVVPKDVLAFLKPKGLVFEDGPFPQKHHFVMWSYTKDYVVKKVLSTWNLVGYVYFFDLEENLRLHRPGSFSFSGTIEDRRIIRYEGERLLLSLSPEVYINQELGFLDKKALTKTVIHRNGKTLVEF